VDPPGQGARLAAAGMVGIPAPVPGDGPGSLTGVRQPCCVLCCALPPDMPGHLWPLPWAGFGEAAGDAVEEDVAVFAAE